MSTTISKEKAHKLIDQLPADATWDDLMKEIYIRQVIQKGFDESDTGKTLSVEKIREKYGFTE